MPNGIVSKEDFESIDSVNVKLNILFSTMIEIKDDNSKRLRCLEKRRKRDTATATGAGAVSGFLGALGLKWWIQ